ncbi:hypothetical protein H5410_055550 [Solanum commersonii]|uniref:Uncharacterized protein n=1 Tax=Solanum commersonii TaxID=4109 RepID=A0A9J5WK62_SOLCO|nr:hypothetical protein H5410_055550 [Solanum commersonii]
MLSTRKLETRQATHSNDFNKYHINIDVTERNYEQAWTKHDELIIFKITTCNSDNSYSKIAKHNRLVHSHPPNT